MFGVEVRFDDRLVDQRTHGCHGEAKPQAPRRVTDDALLVATEGRITNQASWVTGCSADLDTAWEIRLVTPTTFSSMFRSLSPATINCFRSGAMRGIECSPLRSIRDAG